MVFSRIRLAAFLLGFSAVVPIPFRANAQSEPVPRTLMLNGSAKLVHGPFGRPVIWLNPAQRDQAGSAFANITFGPEYVFRIFFQFQMINPGSQASDGIAFVIQTQGPDALGGIGGYLGYSGISPSVAVELAKRLGHQ